MIIIIFTSLDQALESIWLKQLKPIRKSKEVYWDHQKDIKRPFRKDPTLSRQQQKTGEQPSSRKGMMGDGGNFWVFSGKKYFSESSLPSQNLLESNSAGLSRHNSRCTNRQSAFSDKKVVQRFQHSRVPFSRKTAVFRKKLANSTQKSINASMDLWHRDSVFKITKSIVSPISDKN